MKTSLQAAQEIAVLINSRPVSPRIDELEAVISSVMTRQDARQEEQTLAALQQKIAEVDRLYAVAKAEPAGQRALLDRADAADNELAAISKRIFAARPVTLHNLKLRAVLAKYWQQRRPDGKACVTPNDCDAWEDQCLAHLIEGVLQIDAQPTQSSRELALFQSALEGLREFVRTNPEPRDMHSQEHDRWFEEQGQRMEGLDRVVSAILSGNAPPLDVLAAIAGEYALPIGYPRVEHIADEEAHDGISDWVVKRLVHALLPSRDMSAILKNPTTS